MPDRMAVQWPYLPLLAPLALAAALVAGGEAARAEQQAGVADGVRAEDAQAERMIEAFRNWAVRWRMSEASIAITRDGAVVSSAGIGGRRPTTPALQASLSKAITAVCVAKLVTSGDLRFTDRLGDLLRGFFATHGPPRDKRALQITVGQLLTHTSGIVSDATQGAGLAGLPPSRTNLGAQLARGLDSRLGERPGRKFVYNNINYVALGLIVETVTGRAYESHCREVVFAPLRISRAGLDPRLRIFSSYGGWVLSAEDYATFLGYFYPTQDKLGLALKDWPKGRAGEDVFYGLGTLIRPGAPGTSNFWHAGAVAWSDPKVSVGSYFAIWNQQIGFAANFSPQPTDAAFADLDERLFRAAFP